MRACITYYVGRLSEEDTAILNWHQERMFLFYFTILCVGNDKKSDILNRLSRKMSTNKIQIVLFFLQYWN